MKRQRIGFHAVSAAALLLVAAMGGAGCQHGGANTKTASTKKTDAASLPDLNAPVKNSDRWKVKADTTPFYHYGPQQLNGSDMDLKKEARITMVQHGRGYSQIRTADGQTGYVGTEDIAPLSAQEIAAEDAQKLAAAAAAAPPGALNGPVYTIPAEAGHSEPLPAAAPPTPTPPPAGIFRY